MADAVTSSAEWMHTHNTDVFDESDEMNLAPSFNVALQSFQLVVRLNGETGRVSRWNLTFAVGTRVSASTVSDLNQKIYGKINEWRERPLVGDFLG
jgi:hypothetical protein